MSKIKNVEMKRSEYVKKRFKIRYIYTYIHINMYIYIYILHIYIYIYVYTHKYVYIYINICVYKYMNKYSICALICKGCVFIYVNPMKGVCISVLNYKPVEEIVV